MTSINGSLHYTLLINCSQRKDLCDAQADKYSW